MGSKGCPFSLSKAIKAWMLLDEMVRNGPKWSENHGELSKIIQNPGKSKGNHAEKQHLG
jgi:hypothetical protein